MASGTSAGTVISRAMRGLALKVTPQALSSQKDIDRFPIVLPGEQCPSPYSIMGTQRVDVYTLDLGTPSIARDVNHPSSRCHGRPFDLFDLIGMTFPAILRRMIEVGRIGYQVSMCGR
tara:strand:- start:59 stop:412 length:354 start_codon:yes stop_codon:yes gene_type:complete